VNFDSSGLRAIDPTTTPRGQYNANTDIIRAGQRGSVEPRLSYPFQVGRYLDFLPSVSYNETNYQFGLGDQPSAYRRYFRDTLSTRTQFSHIFGDTDDIEAVRYKHEVEPEVVYTNLPWYEQNNHPFFAASDQFYRRDQVLTNYDIPQFDYEDRLYDRQLATFILSNYLIRRTYNGESGNYSQLALFRLSQSFDFYEDSRPLKTFETREPWSDIDALLDLRLGWLDTNTVAKYYPYENVTSISSRIKAKNSRLDYIQMIYSQDFQILRAGILTAANAPNPQTQILNPTQNLDMQAGKKFKYFWLSGGITYDVVSRTWTQYQYAIDILPPGDCWSVSLGQVVPISNGGGEPTFQFAFNLNYGAGQKTISSNTMSQFK